MMPITDLEWLSKNDTNSFDSQLSPRIDPTHFENLVLEASKFDLRPYVRLFAASNVTRVKE